MPNGADVLCQSLLQNGIDTCFANPGTSEMHFVAALDRTPQMRCVLGLSEGVVTGAADGYARMAGRPAATLLHLGPGLANGLANIHNARRANSPMLNIVGDHPSYHLPYDAPLTSDIEGLARAMRHWVVRADTPAQVSAATAAAICAATAPPGHIATLVLAADAAWGETSAEVVRCVLQPAPPVDPARVDAVRRLLANGRRTTILLSGEGLSAAALEAADRIAQTTGARLLAQQSNGRMARGAGRVAITRTPYPIGPALEAFAEVDQLILAGARAPVAFFAYPGKPSDLLPADCVVLDLAEPQQDVAGALEALAQALAPKGHASPRLAARGDRSLPAGALTAAAIAQALTALAPEEAILCDESVSAGRAIFDLTHGAAAHDHIQLTGGAIGLGLPMATGAAIACPSRRVIALQADGSGMYTVQALWTQAREALDVVTIILANRSYAILHQEMLQVGAPSPGGNARRMLDLTNPSLDWVSLARGMGVEAAQALDAEQFSTLLAAALTRKGPFLIEAVLA